MKKPDTKELKCEARNALKDQHAVLAGITLLLNVLNLVLSWLATMAVPYGSGLLSILLYFGCSILVNMIYYLLLAGLYRIYLDIISGRSFRWTDLFSAFTEHPEPVAIYSVVQYALYYVFTQICVWWLGGILNWLFYGDPAAILFRTAVTFISAILFLFIQISLSMVLFVRAADPWQSFRDMLAEGWRLMNGMRLRYFYLLISFIGMYLLCIPSFGIGILFVEPYVYTTKGFFYKKISGN